MEKSLQVLTILINLITYLYISFVIVSDTGDADVSNDVIDVTVPLQCLIKDSKLIIHENSKVRISFDSVIV